MRSKLNYFLLGLGASMVVTSGWRNDIWGFCVGMVIFAIACGTSK